ncbi:MAG: T9SS type A sorting domain-containing protein, partial [Candidatus Eisenbacteria bacterium]|nr:T9SS type A sorting domain-containing protein [Candidatus Eisenbacteria bacterium]
NGFNMPADGVFLIADTADFGNGSLGLTGSVDLNANLNFEDNDNLTFFLVDGRDPGLNPGDGFGNGASDLDQTDDGVIDDPCNCTVPPGGPPWLFLIDEVSIIQNPSGGDLFYSPVGVGPDGGNAPGHVFRCNSNPNDWQIGDFASGALDSPGEINDPLCGPGLIDRETAIGIFMSNMPPVNPDSATTAAYMYLLSDGADSTLYPGDVVSDVDSTFVLPIVNPTYMFWVDYEVDKFYGHKTEFVFVDATNGTPVTFQSDTWPNINDVEYDEFISLNAQSPNLLFGAGFVPAFNINLPIVPQNDHVSPKVWAIVIAGKNIVGGDTPDEPAIRGDVKRGIDYLNGTGFKGPQIDKDNIKVIGASKPEGQGTGAKRKDIIAFACSLAALPDRCDKLYVFYYGHGLRASSRPGRVIIEQDNNSNRRYYTYTEMFADIKKANAKEHCILLMDCFSGSAKGPFERSGLKGTCITSSSSSKPTWRQGDGSAFMNALYRCAKSPAGDLNGDCKKPPPEILAWAIARSDSTKDRDPQSWINPGRRIRVVQPPVCSTYDERSRKLSKNWRKFWIWPGADNHPVAGGTINGDDEDPATLIWEIKEIPYSAASGINDPAATDIKTTRWLYVKNPHPRPGGNLTPPFKVHVMCRKEGVSPDDTLMTVWPQLEGSRRYCLKGIPDGCKIYLLRGAAVPKDGPKPPIVQEGSSSPGIMELADALGVDDPPLSWKETYAPGEFIFINELIDADSLDVFEPSITGPAGWGTAVSPDTTFIMPGGCDSTYVFATATVPDTATTGGRIEMTMANITRPDTIVYVYDVLVTDSLTTPIGDGDSFSYQALLSETGMAPSTGTVTMNHTAVALYANTSVTIPSAASLIGEFGSIYADSGWTVPFSVSGSVDLENFTISGMSNGMVLSGATGTMNSIYAMFSSGDGVTITGGDQSGLAIDVLHIDQTVGDGIVLDGATALLVDNLSISQVAGDEVRAINGTVAELRNTQLEMETFDIDGTSTITRSWDRLYQAVAANGDSIPGVEICIINALGDTVVCDTTDESGFIGAAALVEYVNAGGVVTSHSPHTIHASIGLNDTTVVDSVSFFGGDVIFLEGIPSVTGIDDPPVLPTFRLAQNYPNPFFSRTRIGFSVPSEAEVKLQIFDLRGRLIDTLLEERLDAGPYEVDWRKGTKVASGVYFYRLQVGSKTQTRKMVVVR